MRLVLLCLTLCACLAACNSQPQSVISLAQLPSQGDPSQGEILFSQDLGAAPCSSCHNPDATGSPLLDGFSNVAASRVPDQDARTYAFYSIVEPWQHLTPNYGNAMPDTYDNVLTPQQIADLIAYLLSL